MDPNLATAIVGLALLGALAAYLTIQLHRDSKACEATSRINREEPQKEYAIPRAKTKINLYGQEEEYK